MTLFHLTPARLAVRLIVYFILFFGVTFLLVQVWPQATQYLPLGGHDALDIFEVRDDANTLPFSQSRDEGEIEIVATGAPTATELKTAVLFLSLHLSGTILLMIPITWTYMATKADVGYRKNFTHALIVLPICATTIVLLIQDSLALAFGLAALVAAVRFRVILDEAIDGIYVFAAICVGLAAGIGFVSIAAVMTVFFCFAQLIMWQLNYGENPVEQAKQDRKRAKLNDRGE